MGIRLLRSVAMVVAAWTKLFSRNSRSLVSSLSTKKKPRYENLEDLVCTQIFEVELEKRKPEDAPVWCKTIIMGEKCEPLDFPGVIYYDSNGKQLDHIPTLSPRHPKSPLKGCLYSPAHLGRSK